MKKLFIAALLCGSSALSAQTLTGVSTPATTNASDLISGTVAAARGGAGTVNGVLAGNGSGVVSQGACSGLSNGATGCSTTVGTSATVNTGTSGAVVLLANGANVLSGAQTNSTASAASTSADIYTGAIFTGGSGTTTFPHILLQPTSATAATTWSTSGTALGINAATGFAGNFLDFRVAGASLFGLSAAGAITASSTITGASLVSNGNTLAAAASILGWNGRVSLLSSSSSMFSIGGSTSAFPALKRNSTAVNFRLADDSADAPITAAGITASGALINSGITTDATHTDSTVCQDTTTHQFYTGSGTIGICLGTSSKRFKHSIKPLSQGLREIMYLRPVSYYYNKGYGTPTKQLYGFIAEDMQPVLPKLVGLDSHGRPQSADYLGVIPVLVKAVQEQQAQIAELRAELAALKW